MQNMWNTPSISAMVAAADVTVRMILLVSELRNLVITSARKIDPKTFNSGSFSGKVCASIAQRLERQPCKL